MRFNHLFFCLILSLNVTYAFTQNKLPLATDKKLSLSAFFSDSNRKNITLTVVPGLGNKKGNMFKRINVYSINIFAGASAGNEKLEIGGLMNYESGSVKGLQIAGLCNYVEGSLNGIQIGGLYNRVKGTASGLQIGFINHADSNAGLPIGFLSFGKTHLKQIEVSLNEKQLWNFGFRTGVKKLQNIFLLGVQSGQTKLIWTYGYGIGTLVPLEKKWQLSLDWIIQQMRIAGTHDRSANLLNTVFIGFVKPVNSKLSLSFGPSLDVSIFNNKGPNYKSRFSSYTANYSFSENYGEKTVRIWVGIKAGVRIW